MASNHTAAFGLNQWAATDPVVREDFNEDNRKIEAALEEIADTVAGLADNMVTGTFVGTGDRQAHNITLGFKPRILVVSGFWGSQPYQICTVWFLNFAHTFQQESSYTGSSAIALTEDGFQVLASTLNYHNAAGQTEHYLAIR